MGLFIVFEGIEGCGKTTQIALLESYLAEKKLPVIRTREPGGTPVSEEIRKIFLHSSNKEILPLTELLLVVAARVQHVQQVIKPGLDRGAVVLCDRFFDATAAYQGYAGGVSLPVIDQCHDLFLEALAPDITLLFDCPAETGLRRSRSRNREEGIEETEGRFEDKDLAFHTKVRNGYLERARREPERFSVIDAQSSIEETREEILRIVKPVLQERGYGL